MLSVKLTLDLMVHIYYLFMSLHVHLRDLGSDLTPVFQIIEDNPLGSLCRGILVLNTYNVGVYFLMLTYGLLTFLYWVDSFVFSRRDLKKNLIQPLKHLLVLI